MPNNKTVRYSQEDLRNALQEIDRGMPTATASKQYGIPRTTLLYKKNGKYPRDCRKGPPTNLTLFEEESLVKWLFHIADRGFPATKLRLIDSVEMIFKQNKRENNFVNGRPGKKWYASFIKRHPEISNRVSQNLSSGRVAVNEGKIRNWFKEIRAYLEENNYMTILEDPTRIFNADESAFFLSPQGSKVLVKKGSSTVYNFTANNDKECMTGLLNANAAGKVAPPMVIYQYARVPPHITNKMPSGWAIGKSESGWMTGQTFYEYIANVFLPWLKVNDIILPIIFFVDGHSSHLTLPLSDLCSENGIILVALCPNSTHITQPMDVAVFRTLKSAWRETVQRWKIDNSGSKVKKEDFAPILEQAILSSVTPEVLANGFKSTGLYPFNASAIKYDKYFKAGPTLDTSTDVASKSIPNDKLLYLEKFIENETLTQFRNTIGDLWNGDKKDESLYLIWKAIKNEAEILGETKSQLSVDDIEPAQKNIQVEMSTTQEIQTMRSPKLHITEDEPQPSTSGSNANEVEPLLNGTPLKDVPTPFKKCLFWPKSDTKHGKRKSKEKLPAVASSTEWKKYHLQKEKIKEEKEKAKADRKLKREAKRTTSVENIKRVKRKVISSSSSDTSQEVILESEEELYYDISERPNPVERSLLAVGNYVIVVYEHDYFPGIINKINDTSVYVSVMQNSLANTWKWPSKEDSLWYDFKDIMEIIEEPIKANERGAFRVPEFTKYSDYL